jgi:hypothetical protein
MHWLDDPTDVSSQNRPGWHLVDEDSPTRNRKVEGSNPSSGSKTAAQRVYTVLPADGCDCLVDHPLCVNLALEEMVGGTVQRYRRTDAL